MAATAVIGLHEFAYRRFIPSVEAEYELWGTVSHAASDMLALTVVLVGVAYLATPRRSAPE